MASTKPGESLFKYYAIQKQQQCSMGSSAAAVTTTSLQNSMRCMNLTDRVQQDDNKSDQGAAPMTLDHRPLRVNRPRPLDLASQPSQELQYTPDYLTPQEQQFAMEYDPSTLQLEDEGSRSPAPSPHRMVKRPRPHGAHNYPGQDDECSSQSQSQSRSAGEPSTCSKTMPGRPPVPKLKDVQPPMLRNPYLLRNEDGSHVFQPSQGCIPKPGYSRYNWDYAQEEELGHGNFSKVWKATHRLTGVSYAMKTNKVPIHSLTVRNQWLNEMQALAAVQGHPNIITLYDVWFEPDLVERGAEAVYFKLELCGHSLKDMLKKGVPFKDAQLMDVLRQMTSALKHIHSLGMVHLDVKPDNIYVAADGSYKLGDFGLAMLKGGQRAGTSEGDAKYLAPEALKSRDYLTNGLSDRLDVFALGASVYELMLGKELPKNGSMWQDIRNGKLIMAPHISMKLQGLIKKLMAPDPAQRPSADQLLKTVSASPVSPSVKPTHSAPHSS